VNSSMLLIGVMTPRRLSELEFVIIFPQMGENGRVALTFWIGSSTAFIVVSGLDWDSRINPTVLDTWWRSIVTCWMIFAK
jgi:hypothetical protein